MSKISAENKIWVQQGEVDCDEAGWNVYSFILPGFLIILECYLHHFKDTYRYRFSQVYFSV